MLRSPRMGDWFSGLQYLLLSGIGAALVYGAFLLRLPLLRLYIYPRQDLNRMLPSQWPIGMLLIGCIILLFGSYTMGALNVVAKRPRLSTRLLIVGFPLLFAGLLLLVHPTTSTDLYDYLFRGRMLARYTANPFVETPQRFPFDPLLPYVAWPHAVSAYGPLWEAMSLVAARLAGESPGVALTSPQVSLPALMLAYKGLAVLGYLLCGLAIWGALGRIAPEQRWFGLYIWLWNPLVLWESVGAGHNDAWMALLIVLAMWAMHQRRGDADERRGGEEEKRRGGELESGESPPLPLSPSPPLPVLPSPPLPLSRSVGAFLAITLGGLIKYLAVFLGPVLLSATLRRLPNWRARLRLIAIGGLVCTTLVVLAYAPFWVGWETLRNFRDRRTLFTTSWLSALRQLLSSFMADDLAQTIAASLGLALLIVGVCWATWRAWRAPHDLPAHLLWLLLWFLFFCTPWFQPWYLPWVVALVAIQPWRTKEIYGVGVFCYTALLSYIAGGLLLPALRLTVSIFVREVLMSAIIYIPPLVTLGWTHGLTPRGLWRRVRRLAWPSGSRASAFHIRAEK